MSRCWLLKYSQATFIRNLLCCDPNESPHCCLLIWDQNPKQKNGEGKLLYRCNYGFIFFSHLLECDYQPVPVLQATLKRDCYLCMAAGKCYEVRAGVFWTGEFASFQNIPMVNAKMRIVNAVVVWQSEWWENIMLVIFNVLIKYSMWEENGNVCWNRGLLQLNKSCISMC